MDSKPAPDPVGLPPPATTSVPEAIVDEKQANGNASASSSKGEDVALQVNDPMAALTAEEKEIIQRQTDAPTTTVSYFQLFRYANKVDHAIMMVAFVASIAAGATMPLMTVGQPEFLSAHLQCLSDV